MKMMLVFLILQERMHKNSMYTCAHHVINVSGRQRPVQMIIQTFFTPSSLRNDTVSLRDSLLSVMDRLDSTSLHGFITTYSFLCDFFNVPFNEEVTWVCFGSPITDLTLLVYEYAFISTINITTVHNNSVGMIL